MKNTLYTLLCAIVLAFSANAQVLNVPTIEQEQDMWCWNGVCKSALDYYGFVHSQCEMAEWVRTVSNRGFGNQNCCEVPDGQCNQGNSIYNEPGSMQDILLHYAGITSEYKGQFGRTEADLANSIARNAVVPCGWTWSAGLGAGHAVLAHGYVDGNVYYMDPWFGEGKKIATYAAFSSGNDGSDAGHHTWTQGIYFTSDVSAVDTIPCEAPLSVSTSVSGTSISLSWPLIASAQAYEVQYREQGASTWNSETASSNTLTIHSLAPLTTYEFQVASQCNAVSVSDFSSVVTATTEDGPLVYCEAKGNSVSGEWISSVVFGSINNTSNANGGYADFTAQSTSITAGTSETITLTPGFPSNWLYGTMTQPEFWAVWIDLNQDGDFTDANEQRFVSTSSSTVAVSASISIPSGTPAGATRMRIAMKRSAAASSCETFANGEVEDYTINIIADVPPTCDVATNLALSGVTNNSLTASWTGDVDATSYNVDIRENGGAWSTVSASGTSHTFTGLSAETSYDVKVATVCSFGSSDYTSAVSATTSADPTCDTPTGLAVSNVTNNGFTASWNASANATSYAVEISENGGAWSSVSTSNTSYSFSGLSSETDYEVRVSTVCSFGNSGVSGVVSATTLAGPVEYCTASGTTANEWIEAIAIGSISNTSGANGGYGDFTAQSTSLEAGSSASLTITPGFPYSWLWGYTTQPEYYSVWIDLNQDGDFTDAGELLYVSPTSTTAYQAFTVTLNIPASASLGETRMRIASKRSSAANSCGSYQYGEVEDYTINITQSLGGASASVVETAISSEFVSKVFPNPAANQATVEFVLTENASVSLTMMNLAGKVVAKRTWTGEGSAQNISETINVSSLPKGLYLLQLASDKGASQNHKLVVE